MLNVEIKCPTVTIVKGIITPEESCFQEQQFTLESSNAMNNLTASSPVLLLPYNRQHNLEPIIITGCSESDLIYSFYLLSIEASQWKHSRTQRYSTPTGPTFQETFLSKDCSELGPKSTLTIEPASLPHGYYLAVYTVSISSNLVDFRQFIQPIEIVRSDLVTNFGGNDTITSDGEMIKLDFYSSTSDPDVADFDRRKLNYTLICYPESHQSYIFQPSQPQLGATRPTEINPQNYNPWHIQWENLTLIARRSEFNVQIFENNCFSSQIKRERARELIQFDSKTKIFNVSETELEFNNETIYFLLIVRHMIDGRQLIARFELDKRVQFLFDNADLSALEEAMGNLDDLAAANPKKAVELISGLADKLNEMSDNSVSTIFEGERVKYFIFKIDNGRRKWR
jgi:hypothetical protein